jgi:hypothetical protein
MMRGRLVRDMGVLPPHWRGPQNQPRTSRFVLSLKLSRVAVLRLSQDQAMSLLLIILVLFLVFGGGFGAYHSYGAYGPAYGGGRLGI